MFRVTVMEHKSNKVNNSMQVNMQGEVLMNGRYMYDTKDSRFNK